MVYEYFQSEFKLTISNDYGSSKPKNIHIIKHATIGPWSEWSKCTENCLDPKTLKMGQQNRTRTCLKGFNSHITCQSLLKSQDSSIWIENSVCASQVKNQNVVLCPKEKTWTEWTDWTSCAVNSLSQRIRNCVDGTENLCIEKLQGKIHKPCVVKKG